MGYISKSVAISKRERFFPSLWHLGDTSAVQCPVRGSPGQERDWHTDGNPAEATKLVGAGALETEKEADIMGPVHL